MGRAQALSRRCLSRLRGAKEFACLTDKLIAGSPHSRKQIAGLSTRHSRSAAIPERTPSPIHEEPSMKATMLITTAYRSACATSLLVALCGLAMPSWAGRPLATEDAAVLVSDECEIESYVGRVTGGTATRWLQLGCGIGHNTQLALGGGSDSDAGERTQVQAIGGKTFLRELTDEQAGVTLAYTLFGAKQPGKGFRHNADEINAVLTVPHLGWLLHTNIGWHYDRKLGEQSAIWGLAVERPDAIGPLDLMAEVYGDDRTAPWVQVGARWTVIAKRLFLDTSWGVQTDSARAPADRRTKGRLLV